MDEKKLKNTLKNIENSRGVLKTPVLKKLLKDPEVTSIIKDFPGSSNIEKIYNFYRNITEVPKCTCGNPKKFNKFFNYVSCSKSCARKDPNTQKKIEETNLKKYGTKISQQAAAIKDRIKKTNLERYGVEYPNQSPEIQEKIKETNLERYGVENPLQSPEIQEKIKETNLEKYGVDHIWKSPEIQEKIKETNLERYGVENPNQRPEIQEKIKKTNLERYGVEYPNQRPEIQEKIKETNLERYGVEYPNQSPEIQEKIKKTNLERYGVENPLQSPEIQEKIKKTNLERYGVDSIWRKKPSNIYYEELVKRNRSHMKNTENLNKEFIVSNFFKDDTPDIIGISEYFGLDKKNFAGHMRRLGIEYKKKFGLVEKEISKFIKNPVLNDRTIISPKELDIYCEEFKFAVEYDGLLFHSFGKSKYGMFNNYSKEKENRNRHLEKNEACEKQGIQLFHIFENEYQDKTLRRIWISVLENKQGLNKRIGARKCQIKEVPSKDTIDFLNENHLQGYSVAKINIGIFYEEELISLMTFGKSRYSKDIEYELIRFCTKIGYSVQGGASKLLKYFERTYKPKSIISYANRRWSVGGLYEAIGFEFLGDTKPNYFYFHQNKPNILLSRQSFQKHRLKDKLDVFDENLTESENMYNNGYRKIYDCGNKKYIKYY